MGSRLFRGLLLSYCLAAGLAGSALAVESAAHVDAEVYFVEGVVALEEGRNPEAVEILLESVRLDPDEGTYRYALGIGLLRLGNAAKAAVEIEQSLQAAHPPRVDRQRVLADLLTAQQAAQGGALPPAGEIAVPEWQPRPIAVDVRPPWEGAIELSAGVDSNPSLLSEDLRLPLPRGGGLVDGSVSDRVGTVGLRAAYHPPVVPEWSPALQLEIRQSFHSDLGDLDLGQAELSIHLARGQDPRGFLEGPLGPARAPLGGSRFTLLLQGGAAHYQLGREPYLTTLDLAASFSFRESPWTETGIAAAWRDRDFSDDLTGARRLSGQDAQLEISQTFFLGGRDRSLRLGLSQLERTAGRAEALSRMTASLRAGLLLAWKWDLSLLAAWRSDRFDHPESRLFSSTGPPREDDTWRGVIELGREAVPRRRLILRGSWTERDSSIDLGPGLPDLGYRRTTAFMGMEWRL